MSIEACEEGNLDLILDGIFDDIAEESQWHGFSVEKLLAAKVDTRIQVAQAIAQSQIIELQKCANNYESEGYIEYDISIKKDSDGNSSFRGEIDYTRENRDGSSFSAGVKGEMNRDSEGETRGVIEAHVKGRF